MHEINARWTAAGRLSARKRDKSDRLDARAVAERLKLALQQADDVAERIRAIAAAHFVPLTELCGVNLLTAGMLAGVLGPGLRFKNDAALAAYAGVAPLETSSAGRVRHRLNRGGNRRLNALLYRIVITQAHASSEARAYLARRLQEGKTKRSDARTEASRCSSHLAAVGQVPACTSRADASRRRGIALDT